MIVCRLWAHEALRVFHDRLVDDEDRRWFCTYLKDMVEQHIGLKFGDAFGVSASAAPTTSLESDALRRLLYCSFLTQVWQGWYYCM